MGWFMRLNFRFERFQITVPLTGLDRTPAEVVALASQFVSAYSQPGKM